MQPENPKLRPRPDTGEEETASEEWQNLIDDVDTSDIPLHMLKSLKIELSDGSKYIFPISSWITNGSKEEDIVKSIQTWFKSHRKNILNTSFAIDVDLVQKIVQPVTNVTLKDL